MKNKSQENLLKFALKRRKINSKNKRILFKEQIFLGSGHPTDEKRDFSGQDVALLHYMLDLAIETIGGIQQNGLQGYEFNEKDQNEAQLDLEEIVHSIKTALLGEQEPMAYAVFCPKGEYNYRIFADKIEAETVAEEYNEQEDTDHYKAIPLFM